MLHSVVDGLLPDIQALNFADRVAGIVYPLQKKVIDKDRNPIIKTIPIYGNNPTACNNEQYIELVPDDRFMSCIYFEATPEVAVEESTHQGQVTTESTLTLVGWFNLPKINSALKRADGLLRAVLHSIIGTHDIGDVHAVIVPSSFRFRDPSVFSQYTYNEVEKQYLIYPYDFGAIELSVQLSYPICDDEPTISPDCFNT